MASRFFDRTIEQAFRNSDIYKVNVVLEVPAKDRRSYCANSELFSTHISICDERKMSERERKRQLKVYGAKV